MKQEAQFNSEIRVQANAEKVFKQILPELKALTFKNYHVVGGNLASAIEKNQFFCPRGAVYRAVRRLVVQNRGQLPVQRSLLAVVLTSAEVHLAQRRLARELEIHRDSVAMIKRAIVAECTFQGLLEDKVQAVQDALEMRLAQRKLALELEIHRDNVAMIKRTIVTKCTFQDLLEEKVQAVHDVLKLTSDSSATLAEMLPELREGLNLSKGDTIIMLRRLNTRLDWGLGGSAILCMFGLNHPEQPE